MITHGTLASAMNTVVHLRWYSRGQVAGRMTRSPRRSRRPSFVRAFIHGAARIFPGRMYEGRTLKKRQAINLPSAPRVGLLSVALTARAMAQRRVRVFGSAVATAADSARASGRAMVRGSGAALGAASAAALARRAQDWATAWVDCALISLID